MFKEVDWKDLAERAAWTFGQAFLVMWVAMDEPFTTEAFLAAAAGGVSALKTFIVAWWKAR